MKIIIINGYAGVGKSTFVEMCKKDYLVTELSTIDPITIIYIPIIIEDMRR